MPFGLTNNDRANVAFKNILGRAQTRDIHDLGNEPFGIFISTPSKMIWMDEIPISRWDAITQGAVVEIDADLTVHPNSDSHGYYTTYPTIPPSGTDPRTGSGFTYGVGSLSGISSGDRILDIVPYTFNRNGGDVTDLDSGYTYRLYSDTGMTQEIALLDSRDY